MAATSYVMPNEISAVPTSSSAVGSLSSPRSFKAAISALAKAATDADTDYSNTLTRTYIEERTLEQFSILETIMSAIEQTNYTAEIGNGAYSAKVAWAEEEGKGGVEMDTKRVETWVCRADWVDANGEVVSDQASAAGLRLRAWIEKDGDAGPEIVRGQVVITTPPSRNDDGSYANYGEWTMNVKFGEGDNDYFVASSSISGDDNIIMVHDRFEENFPGADLSALADPTVDMKAILHRSAATGYGKVAYPDFSALFDPESMGALTSIPLLQATYAYNDTHLAVKNGDEAQVFKDRNSVVPMTHRYGVFNKDTGRDLMKLKSFGFPVRFDLDGITRHAYYGSWQGRHELWMEFNASIPEGTALTRDDLPPEESESYVVGPTFSGTFARRTYLDAELGDIQNIPVEIWIDQNYQLVFANCDNDPESEWCDCNVVDWTDTGPQCAEGEIASSAFDLTLLLVGDSDTKKYASIDGFDQSSNEDKQFVYVENDGIYEAQETETQFGIRFVSTGVPINTDNVPMLWVNVGGSIYVEYKGATEGWVEKELISFDTMHWKPTFNDSGDKPYVLPEGRELYVNMDGANYVVTRSGSDYTVKLELQSVANPVNASTFVAAGTVFKNGWDQSDSGSTYEFITVSSDSRFLMLVYRTIGDDDKDPEGNPNEGVSVGAVVAESIWGLRATIDGDDVDFNWEYSEGGGWGSVTYLKNTDGTYKILDDPVLFDSITVANGAGESKTLSLKYDGWMHGLPEMYDELEKNNWVITADIKDKIINIPAGTTLVDAVEGTEYLVKPLEQGLFLEVVSDPGNLELTSAEAVDLSEVPDFTDHGMGDVPSDAPLYYSEGECVLASHCGT